MYKVCDKLLENVEQCLPKWEGEKRRDATKKELHLTSLVVVIVIVMTLVSADTLMLQG